MFYFQSSLTAQNNFLDMTGASNQWVLSSCNVPLSGNDALTMEFMMRKEDLSNNWMLGLGIDASGSGNRYHFSSGPGGSLHILSFPVDQPNTGYFIPVNEWHHYAMTWDGSTQIVYVDGVQVFSQTLSPRTLTSNKLILGYPNLAGAGTNGQVDEVRIWNYARSQSDIQSAMNSEVSGSESGLLIYYNFNQGTCGGDNTGLAAPEVTDISDGGCGATLTNFVKNGCTSNFVCADPPCNYPEPIIPTCTDADGDGHDDATCGGDDCDDNDADNYPGNTEVCDGQDNNCDGVVDEGFADNDNIADCVDPDDDNDGVDDDDDNCQFDANPGQEDLDADGLGNACDATVSICDAIDALAAYVVTLNLPNNIENFLLNKLNLAKSKYQSGNNNAAIGNMNAFINKVNAKTPSQITPAENAILIGTAQAIIDAINNGNTNCTNGQNYVAPGNSFTTTATAWTPTLRIYPNPANNQVDIRFEGLKGASKLTIVDQFGRTILAQNVEEYQNTFHLDLTDSRFICGLYFVSVSTENQHLVRQLVITK